VSVKEIGVSIGGALGGLWLGRWRLLGTKAEYLKKRRSELTDGWYPMREWGTLWAFRNGDGWLSIVDSGHDDDGRYGVAKRKDGFLSSWESLVRTGAETASYENEGEPGMRS